MFDAIKSMTLFVCTKKSKYCLPIQLCIQQLKKPCQSMQSFSHSHVLSFSSLWILLVRFVAFLHLEPQHLDSQTNWIDRWQLPNRILKDENQLEINNALFGWNYLFLNLLPKTQAMNDLKKQLSTTDSIIFSSFVLIFAGPKLFGITIFSRYLKKKYSKQSELKTFACYILRLCIPLCFSSLAT